MAAGLEFGVDQITVDDHLKRPARGGDERNRLDFWFKCVKQFSRQTDGARGVMSNSAVFDSDDHE